MISLMVRGAALVTASLMAAVFYVSQSPDWGWADARTLPALAGALVLLAVFAMNEQRARHPLVPLTIYLVPTIVRHAASRQRSANA